MPSPFRIAVFGAGGVGGYYGGRLAAHYDASEVEVILIARGENARAIEERGLTVVTSEFEITGQPALVTNDVDRIGPVDLILCAVKSYDLDGIGRLEACVGERTSILPLLNGVDASERIRSIFPSADVWEGCVYILARLSAPGVVTLTRNLNQLYFGSTRAPRAKLARVEQIFQATGANVQLVDDMPRRLWEKFIFISAWATTTTYFDADMGGVVHDAERMRVLRELLVEIEGVAKAVNAGLADDVVVATLRRVESLPTDATSSLHADFRRGGKTELESLTGTVVRLGAVHGVPTPTHDLVLAALRARASAAERNRT